MPPAKSNRARLSPSIFIVTLATDSSPGVRRIASADDRMVPPTHQPTTLTLSAPEIDREISMGAHCAVLDVVIPSKVPARSVRIAPGHHKHRQAVLDRKPDERIGRLEVQNIEL